MCPEETFSPTTRKLDTPLLAAGALIFTKTGDT